MNKLSQFSVLIAGQAHNPSTRFVLFVLSLALFVLAAGAPECGGGIGLSTVKSFTIWN